MIKIKNVYKSIWLKQIFKDDKLSFNRYYTFFDKQSSSFQVL